MIPPSHHLNFSILHNISPLRHTSHEKIKPSCRLPIPRGFYNMHHGPTSSSSRKPCAHSWNSTLPTLEASGGGMPPPSGTPFSHRVAPSFLPRCPKQQGPTIKPGVWEELRISSCTEHESKTSSHSKSQQARSTMVPRPLLSTKGANLPLRRSKLNFNPPKSPRKCLQGRHFIPRGLRSPTRSILTPAIVFFQFSCKIHPFFHPTEPRRINPHLPLALDTQPIQFLRPQAHRRSNVGISCTKDSPTSSLPFSFITSLQITTNRHYFPRKPCQENKTPSYPSPKAVTSQTTKTTRLTNPFAKPNPTHETIPCILLLIRQIQSAKNSNSTDHIWTE